VREGEGERFLIALNFVDRPRRVGLPGDVAVVLSTSGERIEERLRGHIDLAPDEGIVARLT